MAAHDRQVAGRIAKALLLFERGIVFFVNHNEPGVFHGGEYRRTRTDDDGRAAVAGGSKPVKPLAIG